MLADAQSAPDFFDVLIKAAQHLEEFGFAGCSETANAVMVAIGAPKSGSIATRGWFRIEPAACLQPDIRGNPAKVYCYAEAVDRGGRAIERNGKTFAWGGDTELCTRDGLFELSSHNDCAARGFNQTGFAAIDLAGKAVATVRFTER